MNQNKPSIDQKKKKNGRQTILVLCGMNTQTNRELTFSDSQSKQAIIFVLENGCFVNKTIMKTCCLPIGRWFSIAYIMLGCRIPFPVNFSNRELDDYC